MAYEEVDTDNRSVPECLSDLHKLLDEHPAITRVAFEKTTDMIELADVYLRAARLGSPPQQPVTAADILKLAELLLFERARRGAQ